MGSLLSLVLNYLFGVSKNSQFRENDPVRKKTWLREKSRVFPLLIMSFHKNPKRCDLISSLNGAKAFPFQLNVRYHLRFPLPVSFAFLVQKFRIGKRRLAITGKIPDIPGNRGTGGADSNMAETFAAHEE